MSCTNDQHRHPCNSFTPRRSLVRSQYRPPSSALTNRSRSSKFISGALVWRTRTAETQARSRKQPRGFIRELGGGTVARKRARTALVLGAVMTAAGGVAVNRVGGSGWQQIAVFAVACVLFIAAGAAAGWGSSGTRLQLRVADARGRPRQLGELELGELGVHLSRATADGYGPYVAREADRELDEALSGGQTLVAVSGEALAGRTRTLAEATQRHLADCWLVWFEDRPGTRLSDMVAEARRLARGGPVVLWLENAGLTALEQLSCGLLEELPPGFRVLMTLDVDLMDTGVLPAEAARVLSAPGACTPLGPITAGERERLLAEPAYAEIAAAYADEPLMGRLNGLPRQGHPCSRDIRCRKHLPGGRAACGGRLAACRCS